jgi:hypothetical protein
MINVNIITKVGNNNIINKMMLMINSSEINTI